MHYSYTAKSKAGTVSSGLLEADSPVQAQQQLRQQGLFPLSISATDRRRKTSALPVFSGKGRRISKRDLLSLTSQLAIMTRAGIDLASALQSSAEQCPNPRLAATLTQVHQDVESGNSVSQAMRRQMDVFGEAYVASMAAGETAGKLPAVLDRLAKMLRSEIKFRATVRGLLAYPVILSIVSSVVIAGLLLFVLPQFANIFADYDVPLPMITRILLDVSSEVQVRYWLYLPLAVLAVGAIQWTRTSRRGQRVLDHVMLNGPVVSGVTQTMLIGRAFQLLGIMLESGVPLLEGLRLSRSSIRNWHYRDLFTHLEHDILNGQGMSQTLKETSFVPAAAAQMVATGEQTGTLAMVTRTMGEFYEEEGELKLRELATIVEPLIIVVMGVVVATVVLSVMLPMFDFATLAGKH